MEQSKPVRSVENKKMIQTAIDGVPEATFVWYSMTGDGLISEIKAFRTREEMDTWTTAKRKFDILEKLYGRD